MNYVEDEVHFVAFVEPQTTMLQSLRDRNEHPIYSVDQEVLLVSSPGRGVLDSGCGKTIIGANSLGKFRELWQKQGIREPPIHREVNIFKFGNGHREVSDQVLNLPVGIGGRRGTIAAAIVQGDAPLLVSRPAMKAMKARLHFEDDSLRLFPDNIEVPVELNEAGQYTVSVLDFPVNMPEAPKPVVTNSQSQKSTTPCTANATEIDPKTKTHSPIQDNNPKCQEVLTASRKKGGITKKQLRSLQAQVKKGTTPLGKKYLIAEIFSPPRLTPQVEALGFRGLSVDIKQGWDLTCTKTQDWLAQELDRFPPELLLLCPPCTDAGGWFHYNSCFMSMQEVLRRKMTLRKHVKFCERLVRQQLKHGGRVLLEHPRGSEMWQDPEIKKWCEELHSFVIDMCCFNLHVPANGMNPKKLIQKATRLLVSHEDMTCLQKTCPGAAHGTHAVIAGSHPKIGKVSQHAGRYTPEFVKAVLKTLPRLCTTEVLAVDEELLWYQRVSHEVLVAEKEEVSDETLNSALLKLRKNLGHPSPDELVRVLKHGNANSRALTLARQLKCQLCEANRKPSIPLPAQAPSPRLQQASWN